MADKGPAADAHSSTELHHEIARAAGTPVYVYDADLFWARIDRLEEALRETDHAACYALKANDALALVAIAARGGLGADVVSGGELLKALRAGMLPEDIVFSGVGKRRDEIRTALQVGIRSLNVESHAELEVVGEEASDAWVTAPVSIRVNPEVEPGTHPYTATGGSGSKFGIPLDEATAAYRYADSHRWLEPVGISFHVGSQLLDTAPIAEAAEKVAALWRELAGDGIRLRDFDAGGGLGVPYEGQPEPSLSDYVDPLASIARSLGATLVLELGRWLIAEAGALLTEVLYVKETGGRLIVVCDAGMNDLIRPALYDAHHPIELLVPPGSRELRRVDVVGPVCESGDFFALDRELPAPEAGDVIRIGFAGAYARVMGSNYNARPFPPEVLVEAGAWRTIRERQAIEDLSPGERA